MQKEASIPKTSSIRRVVSIEYRIVMDLGITENTQKIGRIQSIFICIT